MTVAATCAYTGLGASSVNGLIRNGVIASIMLGHRRLVFTDSVDEFLDKQRGEQTEFEAVSTPWLPKPARRGRPRKIVEMTPD